MKMFRTSASWVGGIVVGAVIAGTVGVWAQTTPGPDLYKSKEAKQGAIDARNLSSAFRDVSDAVLPAIVSIEATSKRREVVVGDSPLPLQQFEGTPFERFFENDPQLRQFLRRGPQAPQGQQRRQFMPSRQSKGSGFIIDAANGIVMTNSHVVRGAETVLVKLSDGREFESTDFETDPRTDVAIVRIEADNLSEVALGDSDAAKVGDWVLAFGSPFGLDMSVTAGIVSAKGRGPGINEREDYIQTDAAINPGNSGGPLVDLSGQVVGINTAISSRSGGYDGIGFAIPVSMARWVAQQLIDNGEVQRAYLGVGIQPLSNDLAAQFGTDRARGAIITQVFEGSPADRAGLQVGDLVLTLDGREVTGPRKLQAIVELLKIDDSYPVTLLRDGKKMTLNITFNEMPEDFGRVVNTSDSDGESEEQSEEASVEFDDLGLELQDLTSDVAEQLGYGEGVRGVVVTGVTPGSPAQFAGLRPGLVISRAGNSGLSSVDDFKTAYEAANVENGLLLLIRSPQGARFVTLNVE
ncbi:Do family serine endopeptidase [Stratiformator vulcanicus]|uniref:Putative periplasmic serine endoprotease DegP-like n=1 Tax=Stratiformator vulcanicus TaxID=2527980 RepID=A0A517QYT6_9PLAN|nr:Do family serine endopeptidase [Stratiformator vulcanicus]QDT36753.1 putative periplasmic serine endoprotease DegP-like precursor [Stratiformator vulcanicus]